mmetsp:Transcript_72879/g.137864  ORF Transcript_72879/g.137864 Transcript_72879/m.137864 type:complete len:240 (-) Transcript_72879:690-1409(-)
MFPLCCVPSCGALHRVLKITTFALLHQQIERPVVLEILEDAHYVRVVKSLEHRELLAHSLVGSANLISHLLLDDLADTDTSARPTQFGAVRGHVCSPKAPFSEFPPKLIDVGEPPRVALQKLLSPSLVTFLALSLRNRCNVADLSTGQQEAEHPKEHGLELFLTHTCAVPSVLFVQLCYLLLSRHTHLEIHAHFHQSVLERREIQVSERARLCSSEGPFSDLPKLVLALHELSDVLPAL